MAGCYGNHPEDVYFERLLDRYLDEPDEELDDWELDEDWDDVYLDDDDPELSK